MLYHITLAACRKEESYGGASSYNVNVLMGKREEVAQGLSAEDERVV